MRPPAGTRSDVKSAPRHLAATPLAPLLHLGTAHRALPTAPACTTQEIANDLFRFLRLEPWRVNTSQTRKAGGAIMRDSIENADEVASVLKGTVFEGQVDEEFASWRAKAAL